MKRKEESIDQAEEHGTSMADGTASNGDGQGSNKRSKTETPSPSTLVEKEHDQKENANAVVDPEEYLTKRIDLLQKEKELTKLRDEVAKLRQSLPWTLVEKNYKFIGPPNAKANQEEAGKPNEVNEQENVGIETYSLRDLFQGKSQLIVHHLLQLYLWQMMNLRH